MLGVYVNDKSHSNCVKRNKQRNTETRFLKKYMLHSNIQTLFSSLVFFPISYTRSFFVLLLRRQKYYVRCARHFEILLARRHLTVKISSQINLKTYRETIC